MRSTKLLILVIVFVGGAAAPDPFGSEFQVNTTTAGDQKKPQIAMTSAGAFTVVWEGTDADKKGVFGQRYDASGNAVGTEFLVNTTTAGDQKGPAVGMTAAGACLIVWESKPDKRIAAQRFDASGNAVNGEISVSAISNAIGFETIFGSTQNSVDGIQIATQITVDESGTVTDIAAYVGGTSKGVRYALYSDVAGEPGSMLAQTISASSGNAMGWVSIDLPNVVISAGTYWLAVAFEHQNQAYRYNSAGASRYRTNDAQATGFLASWGSSSNSFTRQISIEAGFDPTDAKKPAIAVRNDGGYVVAWEGTDANKKGVFARLFDSSDNPVGSSIPVNTTTFGNQKKQSLAMNGTGSFVVAWEAQDANKKGVFAQRFDPSGNTLGGEFQVNTTTLGDQKGPNVAMADAGGFTFVWEGTDANKKGVFARRYDASGNAVGAEFQINTTTIGDQKKPNIAMLGDGSFTVVWESLDANKKGVFGQQYDASGNTLGAEFQINTTTLNDQKGPAIAASKSRLVVAWEGKVGVQKDVFAQMYGLGKLVLKSWSTNGALTREAKFRTARQAPGWTAPQKDLNYLNQLPPG